MAKANRACPGLFPMTWEKPHASPNVPMTLLVLTQCIPLLCEPAKRILVPCCQRLING